MEIFYIVLPCTASWVTSRRIFWKRNHAAETYWTVLGFHLVKIHEYILFYIYIWWICILYYIYTLLNISDSYTVVCLALECILRKPLSLSTALLLLLSPGHRNMKHVRTMWCRKDRGCSKGTSKGLTVSSASGETRCIERTPALPELEASCGSFSYKRLKQVQFNWKCPNSHRNTSSGWCRSDTGLL